VGTTLSGSGWRISQTEVEITVQSDSEQVKSAASVKRSPRERLLDAANELFYAEGIQSVGIDRVIERAGVAKASLYSTFGSKEELVRAYLDQRHSQILQWRRSAVVGIEDPVEQILAVFDSQARDYQRPDFNGCAFAGAMAEEPVGGVIDGAAHAYRTDIRTLFRELSAAAGAPDPDLLAGQLQMLYDGGGQAAKLDRDPGIAAAQRAAAAALVEAAIPSFTRH
jgi:AcrR family transcriptional regulator